MHQENKPAWEQKVCKCEVNKETCQGLPGALKSLSWTSWAPSGCAAPVILKIQAQYCSLFSFALRCSILTDLGLRQPQFLVYFPVFCDPLREFPNKPQALTSLAVPLKFSWSCRIPYNSKKPPVHGAGLNMLTKNKNKDFIQPISSLEGA